ncbi:FGGY family carbohydrate kinase [Thermatribacter velox]|uniref:FGGY family carbohydrate kinase n=1 Tax=Thermatribacter velox TaxID=3039681 RepID=A0ABZ2YAX7_9BACT
MKEYVLTVDVGTTNLKCIIFDKNGKQIAKETLPNVTEYPKPLFAEQNPEQWIFNLKKITDKLSTLYPQEMESLTCVALTGQMHGPVLINVDSLQVLYPCMIWSDIRAVEEVKVLKDKFGEAYFLNKMGNLPQEAFTLPKMLWLKNHEPFLFKRAIKLVFPKDYLAYVLCGDVSTDYSDASGSLLYDIYKKNWDKDLLKELGFRLDILPDVVDSSCIVGAVSREAAGEFHLPSGLPVIKGAGDLAATALSTGAGVEENVSLCVGTAGQLLFCSDKIRKEVLGKLYVFLHCIPDKYFYLGTVPTGGSALGWFLSSFWGGDPDLFWQKVGEIKKINTDRGLVFYPFLMGTGTPYFNYQAKAAFLGLQVNHKMEDVVLAILEGIAFALKDSLEEALTTFRKVERVILSGGLARLNIWPKIVSNVFNLPTYLVPYVDTASVGACLLGMEAMGLSRETLFKAEDFEGCQFLPEERYAEYYLRLYSFYKSKMVSVLS